MKKTVDKIPFYRLGWNKIKYKVVAFQEIIKVNIVNQFN
jgi:hypothetical protein